MKTDRVVPNRACGEYDPGQHKAHLRFPREVGAGSRPRKLCRWILSGRDNLAKRYLEVVRDLGTEETRGYVP